MVKIINVPDLFQADQIIAYLADNNIHAVKNAAGAGGYTALSSNMSVAGFDILVPEQAAQKAKQLVDDMMKVVEPEDEDEQETTPKKTNWKTLLIRIWAIFMLFMFLIFMVWNILDIMG